MAVPRPEYPRPQFVRPDWLCLNGEWEFEIDHSDTGLERGLKQRRLSGRILVPFCPESVLSGVGNTDFMEAVWYRREVEIPERWSRRQVLLHFQAVDYDATVWVNGREVGRHRGGFSPFTCYLGDAVVPGSTAVIVVRARDPKTEPKPAGKQCPRYANSGCLYTRTTGIWQTVWLEPVPTLHLQRNRVVPDVAGSRFQVVQPLSGNARGFRLRAELRDHVGVVNQCEVAADVDMTPRLDLTVPPERLQLWGPGNPYLYDLDLSLTDADGNVVDSVHCYAGMRGVSVDGNVVRINGEPVFQRLVLDQGYYADGVMTAPSDTALENDIKLALAAGFNGARLHQKVFEERFLYHADRIGYLVWGEFADWGCRPWDARRAIDPHRHQPAASMIAQWHEVLRRDISHPCIIGWCPLNETRQDIEDHITSLDDLTLGLFLATKSADPTRPVLDASGYAHRLAEADIYDCHDYQQAPERLREDQAGLAEGKPYVNDPKWSVPYGGQPFFVSEFGGIWWNPHAAQGEDSWGYGERPKSIEQFYDRFEGLCMVLLDDPNMFGYCYTQLTDVFQEQNGIYFFDRTAKFDLARLHDIQTRPAAIERGR